MGSRNKKIGKKASEQRFNKTQIDIIKFFKDFKINILRHKKIYGVMVATAYEEGWESDDVKLVGFVSVPIDKINQDTIIEDKTTGIQYGIIGDTTCIVDEKFDLKLVESEYQILDMCAILDHLQEAVDEGLCEFDKSFDIIYVESVDVSESEDLSNDMNER